MMFRHLPFLILGAASLTACNSGDSDWPQASSANTIASYQSFLSKHPNDAHAAAARNRIAELRDEQDWATAQIASTAEGYQRYLAAEPNGAHVQAARDQAMLRGRAEAWQIALTQGTASSIQDFLQKYPDGPDADQAREKLKALAGFRAELGTARTQAMAEHERAMLEKRFLKQLQKIVVVPPDSNAHDYLITSAPMSKRDADAACASIKIAGHSCKVTQARG